jgi:hypothetical protein
MRRLLTRLFAVLLGTVTIAGCGGGSESTATRQPKPDPPKPTLKAATVIGYKDTEAFDQLFEAALTRQDNIILIETPNAEPDWTGRLNGWIAAWNEGGKVQTKDRLKLEGLAYARLESASENPNASRVTISPLPADTAEQARKLIEGIMDRSERLAREFVAWYKDETRRKRRIELLRPYLFNPTKGDSGKYQMLFYR